MFGTAAKIDATQPGLFVKVVETVNAVNQSPLLTNLLEQAGTHRPTQQAVQDAQDVSAIIASRNAFASEAHVHLLRLFGHELRPSAYGGLSRFTRDSGSVSQWVSLQQQILDYLSIHVSCRRDHHIFKPEGV